MLPLLGNGEGKLLADGYEMARDAVFSMLYSRKE